MLLGALVIDLLFIGLGALMRYVAFDPNPAFGFRTTRSMQSPEAWAYANRKSGSLMAVVGLVGLALAILTTVIDATTPLTVTDVGKAFAAFLYMGLPLIGIIAVTIIVELDLKKQFPDKGAPASESGSRTEADTISPNDAAMTPAADDKPMSTAQKIVFSLLCILPLVIAGCCFSMMPETIAVHFDAAGPDGWTPKAQLFFFAAIMAASNVVLVFAYRVFLQQQKSTQGRSAHAPAFAAFSLCMLVSSVAVLYIVLYNLG